MHYITSKSNPIIKEIKKLESKKYRLQQHRYLIEGLHLVEDAYKANAPLSLILYTAKFQDHPLVTQAKVATYGISDSLVHYLSETKTPQGIFATVQMRESTLPKAPKGLWVLLDNVQDPGNVGTIIRTADAAGFDGVLLGSLTADIYQSKVQRAMQGSQFHIPLHTIPTLACLSTFREHGFTIWASEVNAEAHSLPSMTTPPKLLIVMGNEGNGLSEDVLSQCHHNVYIPMYGQAESLNVAIAAAIFMYNARFSMLLG